MANQNVLDLRDVAAKSRELEGQVVTVEGWVRNHRKQKSIGFIEFYDGTVLAPILGTPDPAAAFLEAPIALQRTMIDTLMTVTLKRAKQGKKGFDPESVEIVWK